MGFDRSGGYFSTKYEVNSIWDGIEKDLQRFAGTQVFWHRFSSVDSTVDDIYDIGDNRVFDDPFIVDVVTALRQEGREQVRQEGFYTGDRLQIVLTMREAERRGMADIVTNTDQYLKDRVIYDGVAFSPQSAQIAGTLKEYDTVIGITLIEVRDDEQDWDTVEPEPVFIAPTYPRITSDLSDPADLSLFGGWRLGEALVDADGAWYVMAGLDLSYNVSFGAAISAWSLDDSNPEGPVAEYIDTVVSSEARFPFNSQGGLKGDAVAVGDYGVRAATATFGSTDTILIYTFWRSAGGQTIHAQKVWDEAVPTGTTPTIDGDLQLIKIGTDQFRVVYTVYTNPGYEMRFADFTWTIGNGNATQDVAWTALRSEGSGFGTTPMVMGMWESGTEMVVAHRNHLNEGFITSYNMADPTTQVGETSIGQLNNGGNPNSLVNNQLLRRSSGVRSDGAIVGMVLDGEDATGFTITGGATPTFTPETASQVTTDVKALTGGGTSNGYWWHGVALVDDVNDEFVLVGYDADVFGDYSLYYQIRAKETMVRVSATDFSVVSYTEIGIADDDPALYPLPVSPAFPDMWLKDAFAYSPSADLFVAGGYHTYYEDTAPFTQLTPDAYGISAFKDKSG